jgi:hypothetical protein
MNNETISTCMMMAAMRFFTNPNIPSGDVTRGDGIFSFRIPVYGTGFTDPSFQTRPGTFYWRFLTQDLANEYSQVYLHEIVIQ